MDTSRAKPASLTPENALQAAQAFILSIPDYPGGYSGKGIVTCAGGEKYFTTAYVLIRILRKMGCDLPIQLWYLGENEMDAEMEALVKPYQVECVDALKLRQQFPVRILNGWEIKPYSILHCPFREVLFLDADNVPVRNPEYLFKTPQYLQTGAIFWPDRGRLGPDREIWTVCGIPYRDEPEFESGQLVVDKAKCWRALQLSLWYNEYSDFFYRYVHGDKETFHMAFRKLEHGYAMTSTPMGVNEGGFLQHDLDGKLIFQHRNGRKWSLRDENPSIPGFFWELECMEYLAELRRLWSRSHVQAAAQPTAVSPPVQEIEKRLLRTVFSYHIGSDHPRPFSFKADGTIAMGAGTYETHWKVVRDGQQTSLELYSAHGTACRLHAHLDGLWKGHWLLGTDREVELFPVCTQQWEGQPVHLDLTTFMDQLLHHAEPMSQNTGKGNMGFGWMYYGMVRNYGPDYAVAIGSARGFMPLCAARALQDNGHGKLIFIDPSYRGSGHPAWDGNGQWDDAQEVEKWWAAFGLEGQIQHLKMTSETAFPWVKQQVMDANMTVLIIDGAHTHENSLQDFELYSSLMRRGVVLFHDAVNPACQVNRTLEVLRTRGHSLITLSIDAGLAMLQVTHPPSVEDKWTYLTRPSNRGALIKDLLAPHLRKGDAILDAYCGLSPLPSLIPHAQFYGFDADPQIIAKLRAQHPRHQWEVIEERHVPFADLPEMCDVLTALGLNYGYCDWDAQLAEPNLRYLIRYYHPRVCLFEAAADYHNAEILDGLKQIMEAQGYRCKAEIIHTDLPNFSRRKVLIGLTSAPPPAHNPAR